MQAPICLLALEYAENDKAHAKKLCMGACVTQNEKYKNKGVMVET